MYKLPHWCITDERPSFYDVESATAIEQTAKLYKSMQDLIDEYNTWVDSTNKIIEDFISGTTKDYEAFKIAMAQQYQDFVDIVELKLGAQDKEIKEAVSYMKTELDSSISNIIREMNEAGELDQYILQALEDMQNFINEVQINTVVENKAMTVELIYKGNINKEIVENYDENTKALSLTVN